MKGFKGMLNRDKTFRPKKKFQKDTPQYNLHKFAEASLSAGIDFKQSVKLPHGENLNDWIAVHGVYLERKLSVKEILDLFTSNRHANIRPVEDTLRLIKSKLNDHNDDDLVVSASLPISLSCPVGRSRTVIPIRAFACQHLQCFDAQLFLTMNDFRSMWKCPVCDINAPPNELFRDKYFLKILLELKDNEDVDDINVNADGTYVALQHCREHLNKIRNLVDFWNRINLIYGTVSECCTDETCAMMSGGPKYEYLWRDNDHYKKPTALAAPIYISLLMDWVGSQINDNSIFPISADMLYPRNYIHTVKKIMSRLFRVFVHVYIHHFERLCSIGAEAHVNTCYKHFVFFVLEFDVIEKKELEPLKDMTKKICRID